MIPGDGSTWFYIADAASHELDARFGSVVAVTESSATLACYVVLEASWVIVAGGSVTGPTTRTVCKYAGLVLVDTCDSVSDSDHVTWTRKAGTGTVATLVALAVAIF